MARRIVAAAVVAVGLMLALPAVPEAQSVVTAQILSFWRLLSVGGTFSGETLEYATLAIVSDGYVNFGPLRGSTSYGIRDNGGVIEFKNDGGGWAAASGGASPTGTFLVQTDSGLANQQVMGALGTGMVINTTTTGVQSIYGGTTCSGQFPRSLSALGVATCAKVNLTSDVTGALDPTAFPALSGDVTNAAGSTAVFLQPTAVVAGTYGGSGTAIPSFTVDANGRLTFAADVAPQFTLDSGFFSSLDAGNLTNLQASALTGTIPGANFPILTGDVSTAGGTLATTVGSIGGKTVTLGGALTTVGANTLTITTTGNTALTFPTGGSLVSSTVTTLPSLSSIGTISTGVWNGTAVTPQYGGTGLATLTAHSVLVGEGTSSVYPLAGCTNAVPWWSLSSVDPICQTSPVFTSVGLTGTTILGGTGLAAGAATNTSLVKAVTGIADAVATPVLTVTVPNAANAAVVHVRVLGSLGTGGAIGAFECSATLEGDISVTRTAGLATVPTASSATMTANSCVVGATTITLAYAVSSVSGATSATQTFAVNATITKGGGSSANHSVVLAADVLNSQASGITIS